MMTDLCVMGQWLLALLLIWLVAMTTGLTLRHAEDWTTPIDRRRQQFSLRHLLVFTTLAGIVFAAARTGLGLFVDAISEDPETPIFLFLAIAAVILTLPLLLAGLLPRWPFVAVLSVLALIGFATVWEVTLLRAFPGGNRQGPDTGDFIAINAFTAFTILAGVLILRLNGYGTAAPGQTVKR